MEEYLLIFESILTCGGIAAIAGLIWKVMVQGIEIKTGNDKLDAIILAAQKEAIATDFYIRSMSDGTLTIEEGAEFKNKAAEAIISHLTAVEAITGKQIYNRAEVPLPLPVGGSRDGTTTEQSAEQPAQPVSTPAA